VRMSAVAKSSARRNGCHMGAMLKPQPILHPLRDVGQMHRRPSARWAGPRSPRAGSDARRATGVSNPRTSISLATASVFAKTVAKMLVGISPLVWPAWPSVPWRPDSTAPAYNTVANLRDHGTCPFSSCRQEASTAPASCRAPGRARDEAHGAHEPVRRGRRRCLSRMPQGFAVGAVVVTGAAKARSALEDGHHAIGEEAHVEPRLVVCGMPPKANSVTRWSRPVSRGAPRLLQAVVGRADDLDLARRSPSPSCRKPGVLHLRVRLGVCP
jgi:hypothetical protein